MLLAERPKRQAASWDVFTEQQVVWSTDIRGASCQVTWSQGASKHLRQLDKPVRKRSADTSTTSPGISATRRGTVIGLPGVLGLRAGPVARVVRG